ncbi:GT-D fold domain-containing glycosyltransferase [Streptococcus uberis]|uniref:GT-D fold domain-containing glycosyltransferase n=1 Tax=Streptococcus uberis TaxID=1349 RepID=UPI003D77211F
MISLIDIKTQLQKSYVGKKIISIYHYLIAIPLSKVGLLKYYFIQNKPEFIELKKIRFITNEELFSEIINEKKSLVRFGDGEIAWIYQESKGYFGQKNSKELSEKLKYALQHPGKKSIIAIPNFFGNFDDYTKSRINAKNIHLSKYGKRWFELLDLNYPYGDAFVTRVYNGRLNSDFVKDFDNWKKIWDYRNVVIVEGSGTKFGVGNDLLSNAKSLKRIIAPSENAFSKYNEILTEILNLDNDLLILIALGPTATILSYDLAENYDRQAIDIGHLDIEYEWFLNKTTKPSPVKGKYVNESGGMSLDELDKEILKKYKQEITSVISID